MDLINQAISGVIRPPRHSYSLDELPLFLSSWEQPSFEFTRQPMAITLKRGPILQTSLYYSNKLDPSLGGPCVMYLHGNASSQKEGQFLCSNLCPHNIFVFCFDFAGCGNSGGDYISLGHYEKHDVEFLLEFLARGLNLGPFCLWGRSMGAATALMVRHPLLKGIVVDSAYTSVDDMCKNIALQNQVPEFLLKSSIWALGNFVKSRAGFDMHSVSPFNEIQTAECPALFGHAFDDQLVPLDQGVICLIIIRMRIRLLFSWRVGIMGADLVNGLMKE